MYGVNHLFHARKSTSRNKRLTRSYELLCYLVGKYLHSNGIFRTSTPLLNKFCHFAYLNFFEIQTCVKYNVYLFILLTVADVNANS